MDIPPNIDMVEYFRLNGELESQDLHGAAYWHDSVADRLHNGIQAMGATLPWTKTHNLVRIRPGELSIHAGINGHRKSMVTGQIVLHLAQQGERSCVASLEMKPEATLARLARQASTAVLPSREYIHAFMDWADDKIILYDRIDSTPIESVLGVAYYAAQELGCQHIVIDSLMKCGIGTDDYNKQKKFIDQLAVCAKKTNVHIHLVAHMRKNQDEYHVPGKFDVKGAGELIDLCDNLFIHWKNKAKEEAIENELTGVSLTRQQEAAMNDCDQLFIVGKQRHGEYEGQFKLWFHGESLQMLSSNGLNPAPLILPRAPHVKPLQSTAATL